MRLLLLNDTSLEPHWGCQLAGGEVKRWIVDRIGDNSIDTRSVQWSWKYPLKTTTGSQLKSIVAKPSNYLEELHCLIDSADFVVINGEGTILGNRPPVRTLLAAVKFAVELDKPCAIVNATIVTRKDPIIEEMMSTTFPKVDLICVREIESLAVLRALGINGVICGSDASFSAIDRIFSANTVNKHYIVSEIPNVVIMGSVMLSQKHIKKLKAYICHLKNKHKMQLFFLSVCRADERFLHPLALDFSVRHYGIDDLGPAEAIDLIRMSHLCITGRYHGAIMAIAAGCPFVHYETHSDRISNLCKQLGISNNKINLLKKPSLSETDCTIEDVLITHYDDFCKILRSEFPFQIRLARLQKKYLASFLSGAPSPSNINDSIDKDQKLTSFYRRATVAASLLPSGLSIADFGGYAQIFYEVYSPKQYVSYDLLSSRDKAPGQPKKRAVNIYSLPKPGAHREVDLDKAEFFPEARQCEVAVCLGLLMWLRNWRAFLFKLAKHKFLYILISWDRIGVDRVSEFLRTLGYKNEDEACLGSKSVIALFRKKLE